MGNSFSRNGKADGGRVNYLRFGKCNSSPLYRLDLKESSNAGKPEQEYLMSLVTVKGQQEGYSNLECVRATAVRELQHQLLGPLDSDLVSSALLPPHTKRYEQLLDDDDDDIYIYIYIHIYIYVYLFHISDLTFV